MRGIVWCSNFQEGVAKMDEIRSHYDCLPLIVTKGNNRYEIHYENGDYWKVCTASGHARGNKCNVSYVSRKISANIFDTIIRPCTRLHPYQAFAYYGVGDLFVVG